MGAESIVRRAHFDDLSTVLQLWETAGVTPPSVSDSVEGLTLLMRCSDAVLLIATINDQIVGSVIGGWDGWRGNIYRLAVVPQFRRQGIARQLVEEVSRVLFDKGAQRLSALVEYEHPWAMNFWNSMRELGFDYDPKFARYIKDRSRCSK
jgi:ribosomal protein S18 acetylase RimI-like enzyme